MHKLVFFLVWLVLTGASNADAGKDLPREIVVNGVEFVLVPEGWFHFSVPDRDPKTGEARRHGRLEVKAWTDTFYIGKYEARARDFVRFMNSGAARYARQYGSIPENQKWLDGETEGCSVRLNKSDNSYFLVEPQLDLPATHLSWDLANEFAAWMGFRFPTDAQWVRAFRGDDRRIFPWGNEFPDDTFAAFEEGATKCAVQPVTQYPKGRSAFGAYNMAGNVFEYVEDWLNFAYMGKLQDGVRNPRAAEPFQTSDMEKPLRMLRGGRWASGAGELSIYGNRDTQPTDEGFRCFGARFALNADAAREFIANGKATVVQ